MNIIKTTVEGKAKIGKSTIMEIIQNVLNYDFYVESSSIFDEDFPPKSPLFKRIDALKKKEIKIIIKEKINND